MRKEAGSLKKGDFILSQGDIWQVQKADFNFQGRGMATVKIRIKNVTSKKNIDNTYKSTEDVETAEVASREMQFLYKDGENLYFMDERSYNQYTVSLDLVGDVADFLKEGAKYFVLIHDDRPLSVRTPASVALRVIETEDAARGDTVSGAKKQAKLETGVTVMVPLFIKVNDMIVVNPETKQYTERVKS